MFILGHVYGPWRNEKYNMCDPLLIEGLQM